MHLIDVDNVGLQTAQRIFDLFLNAGLRTVTKDLAVVRPVEGHLGGDDRIAAPSPQQRSTDDLLGISEAVHGRGIEEINAEIESGMDRRDRFLLFGPTPHPAADRPGTQADA